jgi:hypothetical protein
MRNGREWVRICAGFTFVLAIVLTDKAFGDGISSLDNARVKTFAGRFLDSQTSAQIHVRPQNTVIGTERDYDVFLNGGNYSTPIKLFPGLNLIEAITSTGKQPFRANFKVDAPSLRVEISCSPVRILGFFVDTENPLSYNGYDTWFYVNNGDTFPPTNETGVNIPQAKAGVYYISVFVDYWCYEYTVPTPPVTATVRILLNEKQMSSCSRSMTWGDDGWPLFFCWNVNSVVLHSGTESGGYRVNESGYRDITEQGALVGVEGIENIITEFTGNGGTGPIYLEVGKSAQFKAKGIDFYGYLNQQTDQDFIGCFGVQTISGTNVAFIDELGVLTALSPGHVRIWCGYYEDDPAPIDVYILKVDIIEDTTTDYNFSPSLGEQAALKVKVEPTPPAGGYGGLYFKLEIVRELQGGGEQHIDWLDVDDDPAYGWARYVDFGTISFVWNGIPSLAFGNSAAQAQCPDIFTGVSASFSRVLPAVSLGQCVPPPVYTAVATIRRESDGAVLCEDRQRILVPQVVKMVYDTNAVTLLRSPLINPESPTNLIEQMTDVEWNAVTTQIPSQVESFYGGSVNVRVVDASANPQQPYAVLRLIQGLPGNVGGEATLDFPNTNPQDEGTIHVITFRESVVAAYILDPTFSIPVLSNEHGFCFARTGAHELGHMLGLVAAGGVLNGDSGSHNRPSYTARMLMNPGSDGLTARLGREGAWGWRALNKSFLEFVLPTE